jgi:hypothetical protein
LPTVLTVNCRFSVHGRHIANRLVKIVTEAKKLATPDKYAEIGRINGVVGNRGGAGR